MMDGHQKAQFLLSVLGDKSQTILQKLSPASAQSLTASVGDTPTLKDEEKQAFLISVLDDVDVKRQAALFDAPQDSSGLDEELPEGMISDDFLSDSGDSKEEVREPVRDPLLRSSSHIARLVAEQKPQVQAFFLSRLDETLRNEVLAYLPDEVIADYENRDVESIPLSDKVFNNLYEAICKKSPEDEEQDPSGNPDVDDFASFF